MIAMSQQLQSDLSAAGTTDPLQHRLPLPKLDILAVDADETQPEEWEAEDNVKGGPLDPREVKAARQKEIQYLWNTEVSEYSTEAESRARTERNPVGLKWIDANKGSAEAPRYRSRLVCTEVHHKGVEPIFSATPPLETLRVLLCVACQEDVVRVEDPFLISIADVSRAHFYADAVRDVYVRLPDEDPKTKQPSVCGKLRKTMCGSLKAAQRWGEHYAQVLETGGFSRGVASPCHFFPPRLGDVHSGARRCFFHSGPTGGAKACTEFAARCIRAEQSCDSGPRVVAVTDSEFLGQDADVATVGNRVRARPAACFPRLKALGLTNAKGVATPRTDDVGGPKASEISEMRRTAKWHDPPEEIKEEDDLLAGEELKLFQSVAARFNFLAMDRPALLYSVKEFMREMASPRTQDLTALKRVARDTIKYPRMTCRYRWTELDSNIEVFGDANFAGCNSTRKSTVGRRDVEW